ncbi:hypothetical protein [Parasitella parasitica]|uniref:BZIP domain-containing protein n=1 Tax=Parasitella parasitica TaxID=35722 RepID=A0A0B7NKG2_9FUNG|nr:hypothetical protein [Parasitella parasitica]
MTMNSDSPASSSSMQYHHQMSISSITSSPRPTSTKLISKLPVNTSSPPLTQHRDPKSLNNTPNIPCFIHMPDSPESPSFHDAAVGAPTTSYFAPKQPDYQSSFSGAYRHERRYHPYHQCDTVVAPDTGLNTSKRVNQYSYAADRSSSISSAASTSAPPLLTLQERRQRNKVVSAKYRGKKKEEYMVMQHRVSALLKDNEVLLRQMDQLRRENHKLKSTCDKFRGKMMAEKMLKKMLRQQGIAGHQQEDDDDDDEDDELDDDSDDENNRTESFLDRGRNNNAYYSGNNSPIITKLKEIDFSSDEEDDKYKQPTFSGRPRPF